VREVIARLVDGSEFHEFKPGYGETLVCGFATSTATPSASSPTTAILFSQSALKGAHFIELACQRKHPARLPAEHHRLHGRSRVRGGRHRQGRRQAGHCRGLRRGAQVHGHHRRLFGAGNYGMAGRAYGSRGLWMWPNARIS
jgi:3-methylcrotonyl-CoA carboxylase beta subunit